jgi:hypothetical protein
MISSLVHMSLSSGVLLASWLLEEEMVVLDMAEEMVVLDMVEEMVVWEQISVMMPLPLPLMAEEFVACCCHYC